VAPISEEQQALALKSSTMNLQVVASWNYTLQLSALTIKLLDKAGDSTKVII